MKAPILPLVLPLVFVPVAGAAPSGSAQTPSRLPSEALDLRLAAPIATWDEAIPLGNGTMGVLLWGEGGTLRLSLDRGDLWDERPSRRFTGVKHRFTWKTMQELVAADRMKEFDEIFDSNYDYEGPPTKLPAGRLELDLAGGARVDSFELKLATAEGVARVAGGGSLRAFVSAADVKEPVAMVRLDGAALDSVRLRTPDAVAKLGYPTAATGETDGFRWFEQQA